MSLAVTKFCLHLSSGVECVVAGLPALQGGEPGQIRKEAATAVGCKCRGSDSPPSSVPVSQFSEQDTGENTHFQINAHNYGQHDTFRLFHGS